MHFEDVYVPYLLAFRLVPLLTIIAHVVLFLNPKTRMVSLPPIIGQYLLTAIVDLMKIVINQNRPSNRGSGKGMPSLHAAVTTYITIMLMQYHIRQR